MEGNSTPGDHDLPPGATLQDEGAAVGTPKTWSTFRNVFASPNAEQERLLASSACDSTGGTVTSKASCGRCATGSFIIVSMLMLALAAALSLAFNDDQPVPKRLLSSDTNLYVVARDFRQSRYLGGHEDFQGSTTPLDPSVATTGVVEQELDASGKPVFKHPILPGFSGKTTFDQWFSTVKGINEEVPLCLEMHKDRKDGAVSFDNKEFFPLDGLGFNDVRMSNTGAIHNYYFTIEIHEEFTYNGGENISVGADDDLWVFINGSLALDLGGLHRTLSGSVDLDDLNLNVGSNATLDVFAAKRRCCGSHFRLETNIQYSNDLCQQQDDQQQDTHCCLSESLSLLCVHQTKWWTLWCPKAHAAAPVGWRVGSASPPADEV